MIECITNVIVYRDQSDIVQYFVFLIHHCTILYDANMSLCVCVCVCVFEGVDYM